MTFDNIEAFAHQVQAQIQKIERRHKRTGEAIDELHEMLAAGLEQFGPDAGCSGDVIAQIVTPKDPR